MKYDDPRREKVDEYLNKIFDEARRVDRDYPDVMAMARVHGLVKYFITALYADLDERSYLVDFLPEKLEKMLEEIGHEEVMRKLES